MKRWKALPNADQMRVEELLADIRALMYVVALQGDGEKRIASERLGAIEQARMEDVP